MQPSDHPVKEYFTLQSQYWSDVYTADDLYSVIYQDRLRYALGMIDALRLPREAKILEVGCGAGYLTVALSLGGFLHVEATDTADGMLARATENAGRRGLSGRINFRIADVHDLPYAPASFDLTIALGVVPWLADPARGIAELARVTRNGGHILLSADNVLRLSHLLDPRRTPILRSLRRPLKRLLPDTRPQPEGLLQVRSERHSPRQIDTMVETAGLHVIARRTVGFGPFTFFGRTILRHAATVRLHHAMQNLADRNVPIVRSTGSHYLVVGRKKTTPG